MWDNYENSDISIISKGDNLENLDNVKRDNLVLLGSSSPACASAAEAGWWLPPHPAWEGNFFTFASVVFIFASLVFLCLLFSIFVSVIFYVCVLYLPFLIFASVIYYICVLYLSFSIFAALSRRCYHPTTTIIVHITSSSWPRISKYWALSDVRSQKKLANGDFVAQSFCSRNKWSRTFQPVFHHHLLFWKESKATKLSILTTF